MNTVSNQEPHGLQVGSTLRFVVGRPRWWKLLLILPLIRWLRERRRAQGVWYVVSVSNNTFRLGAK